MYSLLHCHFESALRALDLARPERVHHLRALYRTPGYLGSSPAERLTLLWRTVLSLTEDDEEIFAESTFHLVVQRLLAEMRASQVEHADLRIGPSTGRWRWMRSAADGIDIFRKELAGSHDLSIAFLAGINMTKPADELDALFDLLLTDGELTARLAGVDVNFLAADLPKFNRYLTALQALQTAGLKVNIHLGELFGNEISHHVLSQITPDRIGHGVLLLHDQYLVEMIKERDVCLDMCPTSNTLLGVTDWTHHSPASRALQLGIPVSINTDDPVLFRTDIDREIHRAGLTDGQRDMVVACAKRYRYGTS
ncbi:hypothetical protein [Pseudofrankia asymbiotica]|uniref:adenosine deaminase n=1 Tax=Pseudofrankia asymbiotica TaxID=1834516 RepID=A0A1V2I296_9ACTN|nr:hypothetical protein [Pseudofrankia asymbiotica]ONH22646.1 hypothetical protein BL253_35080 [Pseudofrankia asymbiotica]